jgi:hypothetical protein
MFTSLQGGGKEYTTLFRLIEKETDLQLLKQKLSKIKSHDSLSATCKYLYKVVTNSMLQFRLDADTTTRLVNDLLKSRIFFEKSLYEEGFALLRKVKRDAENSEEFVIQLWASQTELYYLSNLNFHIVSEKQLVEKQMKIDELLKYQKNIYQHTSLYELLRHRLIYHGEVRTREQQNKLNDLVVSELHYNSNPLADTFESKKIHLLFQSYYFITINDPKSALKTLLRLNELLDKNKDRWIERPIDYLSTIEGILESLLSVKRYQAIQLFLDKLDLLKMNSGYFDVMVAAVKYIYLSARLIHSGEFSAAAKLHQEFNQPLFRKIHLLDLNKQAKVYLFSAITYFVNDNPKQAYVQLNKILLESRVYHTFPIYRTFRLLQLLVHYELGNRDHIDYEIRSLKRTLKGGTRKAYKIEKIVFKFLQMNYLPQLSRHREMTWKKFEVAFQSCAKDAYESQLLKIFDFHMWMKAKILRQPLAQLVKENADTVDTSSSVAATSS